ncbi:hypothetical protein C8Q73DRAFT_654349 [Cubamyces lactineus]|nr:hypothetical protein C8Q73DRAFT_654349 [Cubamyces lactineus]
MSALNQDWLLPHDRCVATPHKRDPKSGTSEKIDGGLYPLQYAPEETQETRWSFIELSIECKTKDVQHDPFDEAKDVPEPVSDIRRSILGRIMTYSILVFGNQHRTHHYTLMILGNSARIIRWDRSGVVATKKFKYVQNPLMLAQFLWRFARMTPAERGHDTTAVRVLPGSAVYKIMQACKTAPKATSGKPVIGDHARQLFVESLDDNQCWRIRVDDEEKGPQYFLVGKPHFQASGLAGRGTRTYVALDVTHRTRRTFAYLKDAWRVAHLKIDQEGKILQELNSADKGGPVSNVPTLRCHGDVEDQVTASQDVWEMKFGGKGLECPLKTHRHYRLVVNEVGLPLNRFESACELVGLFVYCLEAHGEAYKRKGLIHRDISAGNILIYPKPMPTQGGQAREVRVALLADWELAKRVDDDDDGPRQPDRTGTWQFLSANALSHPSKRIMVQDDMESLFHLLLYQAIKYLPHNCFDVGRFIEEYFDGYEELNGTYIVGKEKMNAMRSGVVTTPASEPLVFYLSEPNPPEIAPAKPSTIHEHAQKSSAADSPVALVAPSKTDTNTTSSASPVPELPPVHPINDLFAELLSILHAHYRLNVPLTKTAAGTTTTQSLEPQAKVGSSDSRTMLLEKYKRDRAKAQGKSGATPAITPEERVRLEALASKLASYQELTDIFMDQFAREDWPKADKVRDKLPEQYVSRNAKKRPAEPTWQTSDAQSRHKRSRTSGKPPV